MTEAELSYCLEVRLNAEPATSIISPHAFLLEKIISAKFNLPCGTRLLTFAFDLVVRTNFRFTCSFHAHLPSQVLTGSPSLSLLCSRGSITGDFFARRILQMEPTPGMPGGLDPN